MGLKTSIEYLAILKCMFVILHNLPWMLWNVILSIIPVYLGWAFHDTRNGFFKFIFGFFWLLFIPNTLYIITDLGHIPRQLLRIPPQEAPFLLLQFLLLEIIGVATFILAMYPIERVLKQDKKLQKRQNVQLFLFLLNFVIAFGVILGRVQRTNSWYIFTDLERVIADVLVIATTLEFLLYVLFFGFIGNTLYFSLRSVTMGIFGWYFLPKNKKQ